MARVTKRLRQQRIHKFGARLVLLAVCTAAGGVFIIISGKVEEKDCKGRWTGWLTGVYVHQSTMTHPCETRLLLHSFTHLARPCSSSWKHTATPFGTMIISKFLLCSWFAYIMHYAKFREVCVKEWALLDMDMKSVDFVRRCFGFTWCVFDSTSVLWFLP